jgi:hypothetical protein
MAITKKKKKYSQNSQNIVLEKSGNDVMNLDDFCAKRNVVYTYAEIN